MKKFIKGQALLVDLETKLTEDLNTASRKEIWYKKPSDVSGIWLASVSDKSLQHEVHPSDNNEVGTWLVMAYLEWSASKIYKGAVVEIKVYDSLTGGGIAPIVVPPLVSQTIEGGIATTIEDGVTTVYVNPPSVLLTHTLTMPPYPASKQRITILFGGVIPAGEIVADYFSIEPNVGQSFYEPIPGSIAYGGYVTILEYDTINSMWRRIL